MSRHTDRLERSAESHSGKHKVWARADYQAGRDEGAADMIVAFEQALTAVSIRFLLRPYLDLRDGQPVLLFEAVLDMPLPTKPNPPILARTL